MSKGIYRFYCDFRGGELSGLFVATSERIKDLLGTEVYFGEVLGKHSDVYIEIENEMIKLVSEDKKDIEWFEKLNLETGYNPFDYMNNNE